MPELLGGASCQALHLLFLCLEHSQLAWGASCKSPFPDNLSPLSIMGLWEWCPETSHPLPLTGFSELFSKPKLESSTTRLDQGESLNLWCSIPEAPPANFTIQKENTIVSQSQNFTKIASATDSGTYTCNASMGKVVKRSSAVQITVCGEYILPGSDSLGVG